MPLLFEDHLTTLIHGPVLEELRNLPAESVQTCVTSPPYWGLRDYGNDGQIGLEQTPDEYVANIVKVFREVRRILRDDGTIWLNLGDTYGGMRGNVSPAPDNKHSHAAADTPGYAKRGTTRKQLLGIPWRVALALQGAGWYLRQDIIWHKPTAMPSSVTDRCSAAHEYIFLLSKSPKYYFDHVAILEPAVGGSNGSKFHSGKTGERQKCSSSRERIDCLERRKRSVWSVTTTPYKGAHFATFPPKLIEPCILAGTSEAGCCPLCGTPLKRLYRKEIVRRPRLNDQTARHEAGGGVNACANTVAGSKIETLGWARNCQCPDGAPAPCTVLDPFVGSGTTAMVSRWHNRRCIGIDLSATYLTEYALKRIQTPRKAA